MIAFEPFLLGRIGVGNLRPHRPQWSRHCFSTVAADGRSGTGPLPCARPSASLTIVRSGGTAKPLARLDFGIGAGDADGVDGRTSAFSGAARLRQVVWIACKPEAAVRPRAGACPGAQSGPLRGFAGMAAPPQPQKPEPAYTALPRGSCGPSPTDPGVPTAIGTVIGRPVDRTHPSSLDWLRLRDVATVGSIGR